MDPSSTLVPARCGGLVAKIHAGECVLVLGPRIGGTLLDGWRGRLLKDWTLTARLSTGVGVAGSSAH